MDTQKVILITGCSSGFGLLAAVRLASRGHRVWATMRDLSKKDILESELAKHNAKCHIRELDVTQPSTIKDVVEEIQKEHAAVDVLINNAGQLLIGFFEDLQQEEIRRQMEVNFFGAQNVCREVIPLMRGKGRGKIINISSIAGQIATPCMGAYNAGKWALEAFSESLYYELSLFGISVVLVEPGPYPTKIFDQNMQYAKRCNDARSPYFSLSQKLRDFSEKYNHSLKRDPQNVAKLIEKIIDDPHPRLRYVSDFSSAFRVAAQKILPPPLMANIYRRILHANR